MRFDYARDKLLFFFFFVCCATVKTSLELQPPILQGQSFVGLKPPPGLLQTTSMVRSMHSNLNKHLLGLHRPLMVHEHHRNICPIKSNDHRKIKHGTHSPQGTANTATQCQVCLQFQWTQFH